MTPDPRSTAEQTKALLAAIWQRNLPTLRARLDRLEQAAAAAQAHTLSDPARKEAASTAHNLAGTLGMFGYPGATILARRLEETLESPTLEADTFAALVQTLRKALPLEP